MIPHQFFCPTDTDHLKFWTQKLFTTMKRQIVSPSTDYRSRSGPSSLFSLNCHIICIISTFLPLGRIWRYTTSPICSSRSQPRSPSPRALRPQELYRSSRNPEPPLPEPPHQFLTALLPHRHMPCVCLQQNHQNYASQRQECKCCSRDEQCHCNFVRALKPSNKCQIGLSRKIYTGCIENFIFRAKEW